MLPFTRTPSEKTRVERCRAAFIDGKARSSREHRLSTPSAYRRVSRPSGPDFRSVSMIPRVIGRQTHSAKIKQQAKQNLHSVPLFAELASSSSTPTAKAPPEPSPDRAAPALLLKEGTEKDTSTPLTTDDIWNECRDTVFKLEAIISLTFAQETTDNSLFDFGKNSQDADKAFADAKKAIKIAAKRVDHHWRLFKQLSPRQAMWESQVELGQRIRQAHADAMERKERVLDGVMAAQVDSASMEMEELLGQLDPSWFEQASEDHPAP